MTKQGDKLAGVDIEQLRQQLRTESDPKSIKRLTTALLYADGMSPYEIERVLGIHHQTVYDWLDVVAERDHDAQGDAPHPPNASKLTPEQWEHLTAVLNAPPTEAGYNDPAWTPELVHHYITETYEVEYSLAHMYRVLARAGLSRQTARPRHYEADPEEQRRYRAELKKSGRR
jgi:transposase